MLFVSSGADVLDEDVVCSVISYLAVVLGWTVVLGCAVVLGWAVVFGWIVVLIVLSVEAITGGAKSSSSGKPRCSIGSSLVDFKF